MLNLRYNCIVMFKPLEIDSFIKRCKAIAFVAVVATNFGIASAENPDNPGGIINNTEPLPSFMVPHDADSLASGMIQQERETTLDRPLYANPFSSPFNSFSYRHPELNSFRFPTPSTDIFRTDLFAINAVNSRQEMPGMMAIESGRIGIGGAFGSLEWNAWAGVDKYGYFRGMQRSIGFGGQLHYTLSDRWSLTLFGQYYSPVHPLTPAMAGWMNSSRIGGYASYNINSRWGVNVGAQATRSLVTNRWEAQPIVEPYYRINKSVSIGIDVGGILYNVARDYLESRSGGRGNIPSGPVSSGRPPIPTPAKVAGRK